MYGANNIDFKYDDALDFVLFSTITANGTDCICEIVRIMVESESMKLNQTKIREAIPTYANPSSFFHHERERGQRLYHILVLYGERFFDKNLGSCKVKRHVYCSKGLALKFTFDFNALKTTLKSTKEQFNRQPNIPIDDHFKRLISHVETLGGFGPVVSQNFVQLAALIGLIPLEMYNCASLDTNTSNQSRGPCKIISLCLDGTSPDIASDKKRCLPSAKCEEVLTQLHAELNLLWKNASSKGYVENSLCELWRSFPFMKKKGSKNSNTEDTEAELTGHQTLQIAANTIEKKGIENLTPKIKECIYIHRNRCKGRSVQALFRVVNVSSTTKLQMSQHVFTGKDKSHYVETSWLYSDKETGGRNGSDALMHWSSDNILILDSSLSDRFVSKTHVCGSNGCMLCQHAVRTSPEMITTDGKKFTLTKVKKSLKRTHSQNLRHVFDNKMVLGTKINRVVKKVDEKKKMVFEERQRQDEIQNMKIIQTIQRNDSSEVTNDIISSTPSTPRKRKAPKQSNRNSESNDVHDTMELESFMFNMDHREKNWKRKSSDLSDSVFEDAGCTL